MSKLFFRYGAMNSGKSTAMLQVAHNYEERDQRVVLVKSSVDTKGDDQIVSRLGVTRRADLLLSPGQDLRVALQTLSVQRSDRGDGVACVLIDEAQFLTPEQVDQALAIAVLDDDSGGRLWDSYGLSHQGVSGQPTLDGSGALAAGDENHLPMREQGYLQRPPGRAGHYARG